MIDDAKGKKGRKGRRVEKRCVREAGKKKKRKHNQQSTITKRHQTPGPQRHAGERVDVHVHVRVLHEDEDDEDDVGGGGAVDDDVGDVGDDVRYYAHVHVDECVEGTVRVGGKVRRGNMG